MKKIFILTGEASGDKLASTVISKLKKKTFIKKVLDFKQNQMYPVQNLPVNYCFDLKKN